MADRKQVRVRMRRLQTRHFEEAVYAIKRREKGMEPNTVQDSARTIGILTQNGRPWGEKKLEYGSQSTNRQQKTNALTEKKVRLFE